MILPRREDSIHKAALYRLLIHILDNKLLSHHLLFKGGTCASMLGWLQRFSLDLDFDLKQKANKTAIDNALITVINQAGLTIERKAKKTLFFVLKYQAPKELRNTLKLSIVENPPLSNEYEKYYLPEINRYALCQTKETMLANKMVAIIERSKKYQAIAGRDLFDIHSFFSQGFSYNKKVIEERTGMKIKEFLAHLINFIEKKVSNNLLREDLTNLIYPDKLKQIIKTLKTETLIYLKDELQRQVSPTVILKGEADEESFEPV